jgi:hypothetical protein
VKDGREAGEVGVGSSIAADTLLKSATPSLLIVQHPGNPHNLESASLAVPSSRPRSPSIRSSHTLSTPQNAWEKSHGGSAEPLRRLGEAASVSDAFEVSCRCFWWIGKGSRAGGKGRRAVVDRRIDVTSERSGGTSHRMPSCSFAVFSSHLLRLESSDHLADPSFAVPTPAETLSPTSTRLLS